MDSTTLRGLVALRNVIAMEPVATSQTSEDEHRLVHRGRIDELGEVLLTGVSSLGAYSTASLLTELLQRRTLDITEMTDRDDHRIVRIEVLGIELMLVGDDLCAALVTIFLLHLKEVVLHHFLAKFGIVENLLQISDALLQLVVFSMEVIETKLRELRQTHVYDSLRLKLIQVETFLQVALCIRRALTATDDMHYLVDVVAGVDQSFEDMCTLFGFVQIELGAADGHLMTVLYEVSNAFLQREKLRTEL